jgi:nicotinate-nucleotide pyrophosphorylase (carboxylating)
MIDLSHPDIRDCVERALEEDIGPGDITTRTCVPADRTAKGRFLARQQQVVAGTELLAIIYEARGVPSLEIETLSGACVTDGQLIATVRGSARTLLECERVALNFLQHLGGIATMARRYTDAVAGTRCRVLDTRKTTPGLRRLEKMAAAAGGVMNHRMGLYDAILIKNNHIAAAGGVWQAMANAQAVGLPIEIEVRTRAELEQAIAAGATHLLLDNLKPEEAAEQIRWIAGRARVELSGGITLENVRAYAETGADYVSSGAITHSAPAVDISFRLELD